MKIAPLLPCMIACLVVTGLHAQSGLQLKPIATHYTDRFDKGGVETVAYDAASKRLFFTNADANLIGILDIKNPAAPVLVDSILLAPYGEEVTGVAVHNGLIAVAIEGSPKTDNGKVILFDGKGNFQSQFTVGPTPGMIAFTPDGQYVLTANEGEPNDDYTIDPEGSVSIIRVSGGVVKTVDFKSYNSKAATLRNRGIRLYGPKATVAQDLEPESIAVSPDGKKAFVTLQENNAVAIIDIVNAQVIDIQAMGYKDHQTGSPTTQTVALGKAIDLPFLGTPVYKDSLPPIKIGGFSGLWADARLSNDSIYVLYAVSDRGPNSEAVPKANVVAGNEPAFEDLRPLLLPDYQGRITKFLYNRKNGSVKLDSQILLTRVQNDAVVPITGRSNILEFDEIPVTYTRENSQYSVADWVDTLKKVSYTELPYDPFGADFEGIVRDKEGFFWLCDEMRPSVYKFRPDGRMIIRYVPKGTSALGFIDLGPGFYGEETLPRAYSRRWADRGFNGLAYDPDANLLYAFFQSSIDNPQASTVRNKTDVIRILAIKPSDGTPAGEYVYLLENNRDFSAASGISRVDQIGDAVYIGNGRFMVVEEDSSPAGKENGKKMIFEISLKTATNLLADTALAKLAAKEVSTGPNDKTLEMMSADDLAAAGIRPAFKRKMLNLPGVGYTTGSNAEGLALLPNGTLAVINDNGFGIPADSPNAGSSLGIVTLGANNSLDPSNSDGGINIKNYPILGMYQPDGIAAFQSGNQVYTILANEGDARDYAGLNEEVRISTMALDAATFPNAATLKQNANLGQLRASNASGDFDGDKDFDAIFTFGGRSFSIYDSLGNLVFESGNDFENTLAQDPKSSPYFNSNNNSNASFDNRSDDRGPEPSVVATGIVNNVPYAFIGLERQGGIMAYDISNPKQPKFVRYANNRNFTASISSRAAGDLGMEDVLFIPADKSPTGVALLVTASDVSGTLTIYSTDNITPTEEPNLRDLEWSVFPNPVGDELFSNATGDFQVFNAYGQLLQITRNTNRIDVSRLPAGTYVLRYPEINASRVFVKK